jgi:Zn-dependent protease with chaperone function
VNGRSPWVDARLTALLRRLGRTWCWVLLGLATLAHLGVAALAVAEYATLGWLLGTVFDLTAVTLVLASALTGLTACAVVTARAAGASWKLRRLIGPARRPVPAHMRDIVAGLGLADRVDVVRAGEAFAVTHGLGRPRILVSDGLAAALTPAELSAVLVHERYHLRHRDPLRLLAARLLAAYGWYIPAARWLAASLALRGELAADRAAAARAGRGVVAGALLKLAALPACPAAVAAANPAGDAAGSLEARVAQLENRRPQRQRLSLGGILTSTGRLGLLGAAGMCCVGLSFALPGGLL